MDFFMFPDQTEAAASGCHWAHVIDYGADMDYIFSVPASASAVDVAVMVAEGYDFGRADHADLTIYLFAPGIEDAVSRDTIQIEKPAESENAFPGLALLELKWNGESYWVALVSWGELLGHWQLLVGINWDDEEPNGELIAINDLTSRTLSRTPGKFKYILESAPEALMKRIDSAYARCLINGVDLAHMRNSF